MKYNVAGRITQCILSLLMLAIISGGCSNAIREKIEMPPRDIKVSIKSIVVQPFQGSPYGESLAQYIRNQITKTSGNIKVLTSGAEAILTGTLNVGRINIQEYSATSLIKINGQNTQIFNIKKTLNAGVNYSVLKDGSIIGGNSYSRTFEREWSGSSSNEARANATSDDSIVGAVVGDLGNDIVEGISAHSEDIIFKLQDGGNNEAKLGIEYYKKGLHSQAVEYWTQALGTAKNDAERSAAYYDLGVNAMRMKNYHEAFNNFNQADHYVPANDTYMEALSLAKKAHFGSDAINQMNASTQETPVNRGASGKKSKKSHR